MKRIPGIFKQAIHLSLLLVINTNIAQVRNKVNLPDILGYKTLKADFHIHTVFSDGKVWPSIRVEEAWRDGLDVISITDHVNYRAPLTINYVNYEDKNAHYDTALLTALQLGITLIKGAEINFPKPHGHFNMLFLKDVNAVKVQNKDCKRSLEIAKSQGAYIQWNHPPYYQIGTPKWPDLQEEFYKQGLIDGIEIVGDKNLFDVAFPWAEEKKLTITGSSDIHVLIDARHSQSHRPMTLIFAKNNSEEAVKEAMFDKRTAVYYENFIFGDFQFLKPLFEASVKVVDMPCVVDRKNRKFAIENQSDVDFTLELVEKQKGISVPKEIRLVPNKTILNDMTVSDSSVLKNDAVWATYRVTNFKNLKNESLIYKFYFNKKEPVIVRTKEDLKKTLKGDDSEHDEE